MGKILGKICFIWTMLIVLSINIFAKNAPYLFVNGELKDMQVILRDSNTLVPLRFSSEELQAVVNWDKNTQEINIIKGSDEIIFKVDSLDYKHNGETKRLLVVPELLNGITYIPFRTLVEALNGVVLYNNEYKFINTSFL